MAQAIRVQIEDPSQISGGLRALGASGKKIGQVFFKEMGREIVNRARYFAPFRTGRLRKRIRATNPRYQNGEVMMTIEAPYSIIQHEDMTLKHEHGGGPKFIEKAVLEGIDHWGPLILRAIHEAASDPSAVNEYSAALGSGFVGMQQAVESVAPSDGEDWR